MCSPVDGHVYFGPRNTVRTLLFSSAGNTQAVNFSAAAANNIMVGSDPALGEPEVECHRCDAMLGMLARTELGTRVQDVNMMVRWAKIAQKKDTTVFFFPL